MRFLLRLRVQTRLFLAFGLLLACSGFTLPKLGCIQAHLENIVLQNNVKVSLNQQMIDAVHVVKAG